MNWNFSTFFIWKIIKNVTDYETKLFYNTHFLSSFSDVLYQWKDPPPKKVSLLIKCMWFPGTLLVLVTKIIWLSKPYTAHDLIFILFRLSHDIALALKTLKWSLFDIQHSISESHDHFKNWKQVLESFKGFNKA